MKPVDYTALDLSHVDASENCKQLIRAMLAVAPADRPTPEQIMQHPFFQESG